MAHRNFGAPNGRKRIKYDDDLFGTSDSPPSTPSPLRRKQRPEIAEPLQPMQLLSSPSATSSSSPSSPLPPPPRKSVRIIAEPIDDNDFTQLSPVLRYTKRQLIGSGTYGRVFIAKDQQNNEIVAIKTISLQNDSKLAQTTQLSYREIQILRGLHHPNIINLLDVERYRSKGGKYFEIDLVFEYCDYDLSKLIKNRRVKFTLSQIKGIMVQLLTGIEHIHRDNIMHRDIKTENILINSNGIVKIADFGLARPMTSSSSSASLQRQPHYTVPVVTLWYRAPELLLGATAYDASIDLWSAGCIMAELFQRRPILQGDTERQQIMNILNVCGSISTNDWPDVVKLPIYKYVQFPNNHKRRIAQSFRAYIGCDHGLNLLDQLLMLNPNKRPKSTEALNHDFFWTDPLPADLDGFMDHVRSVSNALM